MNSAYEDNVLALVRACWFDRCQPDAVPGYSRVVREDAKRRLARMQNVPRPEELAPRRWRPAAGPDRQLGREVVRWMVQTRSHHAKLCAAAGVSRHELSRLIDGKSVDDSISARVRAVIGGQVA